MFESSDAPANLLLKAVIDTNLFIRGLLKSAVALPILNAFLSARFQLVTSEPLLAELAEVINRPKFRHALDRGEARRLLDFIARRAIVVQPAPDPPECRDPDDRVVLATAIAGGAQFIVTGDSDLRADDRLRAKMLALGVEILGVDGFLARLQTATDMKPAEAE